VSTLRDLSISTTGSITRMASAPAFTEQAYEIEPGCVVTNHTKVRRLMVSDSTFQLKLCYGYLSLEPHSSNFRSSWATSFLEATLSFQFLFSLSMKTLVRPRKLYVDFATFFSMYVKTHLLFLISMRIITERSKHNTRARNILALSLRNARVCQAPRGRYFGPTSSTRFYLVLECSVVWFVYLVFKKVPI
jgi:hypothetical protein